MDEKQFSFTRAALDALPVLDKQYEVVDTKIPGLRLRVNPGNSRTYFLLKKIDGRVKRIKICRYHELPVDAVRIKAIRLSAQISEGIDPQEEKNKKRAEATFQELFDLYYQLHCCAFNKNPAHNKRIIDFHIMPVLGRQRIGTITREKIIRLHQSIGETRGRITANRVMTIAQSAFNFYINGGYWKGVNPCQGLRKFPERSRDRFLSSDEIQSFFAALEQEEIIFQDFFKMALYTGARKTNLLSMKYCDLDLSLHRWRIPETQTKNSEVNIVLLSKPSIEILNRRKEMNEQLETPSEYVFAGSGQKGYLQDPKRAFDRIRARMGVDDIRIHDLRRTLGSYMAINGASLPIIGKALNHKSLRSTEIYARLNYNPVLDAVNNAADAIQSNLPILSVPVC